MLTNQWTLNVASGVWLQSRLWLAKALEVLKGFFKNENIYLTKPWTFYFHLVWYLVLNFELTMKTFSLEKYFASFFLPKQNSVNAHASNSWCCPCILACKAPKGSPQTSENMISLHAHNVWQIMGIRNAHFLLRYLLLSHRRKKVRKLISLSRWNFNHREALESEIQRADSKATKARPMSITFRDIEKHGTVVCCTCRSLTRRKWSEGALTDKDKRRLSDNGSDRSLFGSSRWWVKLLLRLRANTENAMMINYRNYLSRTACQKSAENFLAQRGVMDRANLDYSFNASELHGRWELKIRLRASAAALLLNILEFSLIISPPPSLGLGFCGWHSENRKKFSLIVGCTWTPDFINLQNFQLAIRLNVLTTAKVITFTALCFVCGFCFARNFRVNQTERSSNNDVNVAMVIREIELLLLGVHGRMKSRFCCEYQAAAKRNFSLDSCCVFLSSKLQHVRMRNDCLDFIFLLSLSHNTFSTTTPTNLRVY